MNYLDVLIIILLIIAAVSGFKKGFVHQLFSLLAIILGILLAVKLNTWLTGLITPGIFSSVQTAKIVAFIFVLIVVSILAHLIAKILESFFNDIDLGLINRLTGLIFGVLKMSFILSAFMILVEFSIIKINFPKKESCDSSFLYPKVKVIAPAVFPYLKTITVEMSKTFH
ncbi:MAG TPA: CvpA family protein [Bacteroidales bacterium]|nr:CvpA family protein [Bacteroidales bacterium]